MSKPPTKKALIWYEVNGDIEIPFTVFIQAESEEDAKQRVREHDNYGDFLEGADESNAYLMEGNGYSLNAAPDPEFKSHEYHVSVIYQESEESEEESD